MGLHGWEHITFHNLSQIMDLFEADHENGCPEPYQTKPYQTRFSVAKNISKIKIKQNKIFRNISPLQQRGSEHCRVSEGFSFISSKITSFCHAE